MLGAVVAHLDGPDLLIDHEVSCAVAFAHLTLLNQVGEVLRAVILEVAALVVGALQEEMVGRLRGAEELGQGFAGFDRVRIPALRQVAGEQARDPLFGNIAVVPHDVGLGSLAPVAAVAFAVEVDHPHGDAIGVVVHRLDRGEGVLDRRLHDREVEVLRLVQPAGHQLSVHDLQAGVFVVRVVPGEDRRVVIAVSSPVQVEADRAVGYYLLSLQLRGEEPA